MKIVFSESFYESLDKVLHPSMLEKVKDFFREIKWFIQRGKRGYADCDVWDFDSYLSRVIANGVRELKDGTGYPADLSVRKWNTTLEKIAVGFEAQVKLPDFPTREDEKKLLVKAKIGMELFQKYFKSLWD